MGQSAEGARKIMSALESGLKDSFGGLTQKRMENLSTKISNMGDAFDGLADTFFEEGGIGAAIKSTVDLITDAIVGLNALFMAANRGTTSEIIRMTDPKKQLEALNLQMIGDQLYEQELTRKIENFGKVTRANEFELSGLKSKRTSLRERMTKSGAFADSLRTMMEERRVNLAKQNEANRKRNSDREALAVLDESTSKLQGFMDQFKTQESKLKEALTFLEGIVGNKEALQKAGLTGDGLAELTEKVREELKDLQDASKETADTFKDTMAPAIASMAHSFTNDFVNALIEGGNALDAFKNLAKNIVSQIIATFLQMAVVNKILNAVFGGFGGNPLPTMSYQSGSGFQMDKIPGKARGGPVSGGRPYLVGERGPEIFVPHTGGSVLSNRQSMAAGGGIVINQSLNFSTGVSATVRQEVIKMLPMIGDVSKASVLEAASRGGNFRKGLLGT